MSPIRPLPLEQVSFTGMRDSLDPTTAEPRKALLLQNVYPADTFLGAAVVGRPGFAPMGGQLGVAGHRRLQRAYQFTKTDGTEHTLAFCGGQMYDYDWSLGVWNTVALGGGAVLDLDAAIYCATLADAVIVSDGVHTPFMWDGTTFTVLTNCPVLYGQPVIYYAKLFGIKAAELDTIVWSEENDPTTGYEAGGFNNAWTLGQTSQSPIYALFATNEALYVFRDRSMTAVSGAVTPDFQSAGTRESLSETVGTTSPNAVTYHEGQIYWLSADGYPYVLPVGAKPAPLWADLRESLQTVPRARLNQAVAVHYPACQLVLLGLVQSSTETEVGTLIAIDVRTNEIAGLWTGFHAVTLDLVKDADDVPTVVHGSENGYVYQHGNPDGALWEDTLSATDGGLVPILHTVVGSPLGYSIPVQKKFDRLDLVFRMLTDMSATVDAETPEGQIAAQGLTLESGFAIWDKSLWDVDAWSSTNLERHFAVGFRSFGRWIRPRIVHNGLSERFGLLGWRVTAWPLAPYPREN